jgi:hypothetical protein
VGGREGLGFELRALAHLQPILLWLFWRWGLTNYLPGLTLIQDLPGLNFPNSSDYRCELPVPGSLMSFLSVQYAYEKSDLTQVWWFMSIIPTYRRLRQ